MLRKGACQGFVQPIVLPAGGSCQWAAPVPAPQKYPNRTLALYCAEGDLTLSDAESRRLPGNFCFVKGQMRPSFIWKAKRGLQLWQQ